MNRSDLIAAMQATASLPPKPVDVPGWGTVYVRAITVGEVEEQTGDTQASQDKRRIARGVARVLCNEAGERMFDPASEDDVGLIARQPWTLLRRVLAVADEGQAGNG